MNLANKHRTVLLSGYCLPLNLERKHFLTRDSSVLICCCAWKWDLASFNPSKNPEYIIAVGLRFIKPWGLSGGNVKQLPVERFTLQAVLSLKCNPVQARVSANENYRTHKGKCLVDRMREKKPQEL